MPNYSAYHVVIAISTVDCAEYRMHSGSFSIVDDRMPDGERSPVYSGTCPKPTYDEALIQALGTAARFVAANNGQATFEVID